jgi:NAD(P)-dependent dehydrogenase (short-subunit alcohol dehydrogenase family)
MEGGENIVKTALDSFGRLDIVVTPHGILKDRMLFNMSEEEWDAVIAVHLKGTFTVCKHAAILFRQQRSGRIITFSSTSGLIGNPGQANYGAAKSGIAGFTKVVARDLGRYGVTVNCIAPLAQTRMTASVPESARQISAERGIARGADESNLELAEDIAPMVVYLASDYAYDVNGQIFLVHGGTIALMSQPRPIRTIYKHQACWTLDELSKMVPEHITKGLINPAQPQPARS